MDAHVRFLGKASIAFGIFAAVGALAVLIRFGGFGGLWRWAEGFSGIGLPVTLSVTLHLLVAIPSIVAGRGLLLFRPWARWLDVILSAVNFLNLPFGTMLSVYGFWVLTQHETEPLFDEAAFRRDSLHGTARSKGSHLSE
jgi:hypothetical protein